MKIALKIVSEGLNFFHVFLMTFSDIFDRTFLALGQASYLSIFQVIWLFFVAIFSKSFLITFFLIFKLEKLIEKLKKISSQF